MARKKVEKLLSCAGRGDGRQEVKAGVGRRAGPSASWHVPAAPSRSRDGRWGQTQPWSSGNGHGGGDGLMLGRDINPHQRGEGGTWLGTGPIPEPRGVPTRMLAQPRQLNPGGGRGHSRPLKNHKRSFIKFNEH